MYNVGNVELDIGFYFLRLFLFLYCAVFPQGFLLIFLMDLNIQYHAKSLRDKFVWESA